MCDFCNHIVEDGEAGRHLGDSFAQRTNYYGLIF